MGEQVREFVRVRADHDRHRVSRDRNRVGYDAMKHGTPAYFDELFRLPQPPRCSCGKYEYVGNRLHRRMMRYIAECGNAVEPERIARI